VKLNLQKDNLHHAYFITGARELAREAVLAFVKDTLDIRTTANPDFSYEEYETLGVDDARAIKDRQEKRGFSEGKRVFVIAFNFITGEAQNALLKMFEEPSENALFFVIAPSAAILLPTLKSRLIVIAGEKGDIKNDAKSFLKASVDERLKYAEKFKDAENETKKSELLSLVSDIEKELTQDVAKNKAVFQEIYTVKRFLLARSPSVKMIAEYLALRLPRVLK
jgi:DNA polymerase III delta prime subunit